MEPSPLLEITNLNVEFSARKRVIRALRNVNLKIPKGGIVGVVGESGCGKSTLILSIMRLLASNARVTEGEVMFDGRNLLAISEREMQSVRGNDISMIFQDPLTSLNPVISIGQQLIDVQYRDATSRKEKSQRAIDALAQVGIPDANTRMTSYPHQFSGGMRQRIAIAMTMIEQPTLLIADEPTTALDATLEVQIIRELKLLQEQYECSILFVSHHLGVVADLCDYSPALIEVQNFRSVCDVYCFFVNSKAAATADSSAGV